MDFFPDWVASAIEWVSAAPRRSPQRTLLWIAIGAAGALAYLFFWSFQD